MPLNINHHVDASTFLSYVPLFRSFFFRRKKWEENGNVSDRNKFPFPFSFPNRKLRSRCRYRSDPCVNSLERRKELIRKIPGFGGYKSKSFQVSGKLGITTLGTIEAREIVGKNSGVEC